MIFDFSFPHKNGKQIISIMIESTKISNAHKTYGSIVRKYLRDMETMKNLGDAFGIRRYKKHYPFHFENVGGITTVKEIKGNDPSVISVYTHSEGEIY